MKKLALIFGGFALLTVIVAFALFRGQIMGGGPKKTDTLNTHVVAKGDIATKVIETGAVDAVTSVDVRSLVSGRLKTLLVDEGDEVKQGDLIGIIDPQETELTVSQNRAQLRGAEASVSRAAVEIAQRRVTARENVRQAEIRVATLRSEVKTQPVLTNATIRSAKATLDSAMAEVQRLRSTAHPNQRTATTTSLREAQVNYDNAKAEYDRQRSLLDDGFVSQKVVENANLQVELAQVRLNQARENSTRLESQLSIEIARANDDIRRAQAEYDRARANSIQDTNKGRELQTAIADLEKARIALRDVEAAIYSRAQSQAQVDQLRSVVADGERQLRETEIRAPMDGIITKRNVQVGELVAGQSSFGAGTTLVRLEDRKTMRVTLNVNEIDTARLRKGMAANITVDAIPDKKFKGAVQKIAPASTAIGAAGTSAAASTDTVVKYEVEIWIQGYDERLRSGMSAKCELESDAKKGVTLVPNDYLIREEGKVRVEVVDAQDKTQKRDIVLGAQSGANSEVTSGLNVGEKIKRPEYKGPPRSGFGPGGGDE